MSSATFWLVLSAFLAMTGVMRGFLLDDGSLQNLISLISAEKKLRSQVEQEIQTLKDDTMKAKHDHSSSLCKCSGSSTIAFAATITTDITNFGTQQPLVFDRVITNVGGAYDSRHGTFHTPVTGVYQFSFSVLQGAASMWLGVELVNDGAVIGRVSTGDNGYWNMGSNVINARLAANTDVWVRHMSDSDTKQVIADGGFFTSFSGFLVQAE